MKYDHGYGEMKHKHIGKHDGGHHGMKAENEPPTVKGGKTIITEHQEHEEGNHEHHVHFFSGKTEHEHNKD